MEGCDPGGSSILTCCLIGLCQHGESFTTRVLQWEDCTLARFAPVHLRGASIPLPFVFIFMLSTILNASENG
jgi:hypothetical protein